MARNVFFSFHYGDVLRANVVRNSDVIARRYNSRARYSDRSLWEETKKQGDVAIKRMINKALENTTVTCVLIGGETWSRRWVRYEILKSLARGNGLVGVRIHNVGMDPPGMGKGAFGGALAGPPIPAKNDLLGALASLSQPPASTHNDLLGALASLSQPRVPAKNSLAEALSAISAEPPKNALLGALGGLLSDKKPPAPETSPGPNPLRYLGYAKDNERGRVVLYDVGPNNEWRQCPDLDPISLSDFDYQSPHAESDNLSNLFSTFAWKQDDGYLNLEDWIESAAKQMGQ